MKRNWIQERLVTILLDTLKDPGVTNAWFFEDVEFDGGDKYRDFVFEEEYVDIPKAVIDVD